jgi:hypothetical protein
MESKHNTNKAETIESCGVRFIVLGEASQSSEKQIMIYCPLQNLCLKDGQNQ